MRISMKSDYALWAAMELAASYGGRPLQTSEIAARRGIPESFLEQLLPSLRRAGIVASNRGPQGGHSLAIHPYRVTAGDVIRAVEGPMAVMDCVEASDRCRRSSSCVLKGVWGEVRSAIESVLDRVTIGELAARQSAEDGTTMYYI